MKAHAFALPTALLAAALIGGCGDASIGAAGETTTVTRAGEALTLTPHIDVQGIGEVFETVQLDHLDFDAELFVLPTDNKSNHPGAVVSIRVTVEDGEAHTEALDGDLVLEEAGRYRVLLRIDPSEDGVSVNVDGQVIDPQAVARSKGTAEPAPIAADDDGEGEGDGEPAPTPAEPAPTPAEPAPTPAEPAPTPAEPAPTPAEPAPTPADDPWGDAGEAYEPLPGGGGDAPSSEPAPTPAEPAPTAARGKGGEAGIDPGDSTGSGAAVSVSSRASFEFYVGVVEIETDDRELTITWDVSAWLRDLLAEPLGIAPEAAAETTNGVPGAFHDIAAAFQLIAH